MKKVMFIIIVFQAFVMHSRIDYTHKESQVKDYIHTAYEMGRESIILEAIE